MTHEERITKLQEEATGLKARLDKMNSCHNKSDGQFCSRGGSGGGGGGERDWGGKTSTFNREANPDRINSRLKQMSGREARKELESYGYSLTEAVDRPRVKAQMLEFKGHSGNAVGTTFSLMVDDETGMVRSSHHRTKTNWQQL